MFQSLAFRYSNVFLLVLLYLSSIAEANNETTTASEIGSSNYTGFSALRSASSSTTLSAFGVIPLLSRTSDTSLTPYYSSVIAADTDALTATPASRTHPSATTSASTSEISVGTIAVSLQSSVATYLQSRLQPVRTLLPRSKARCSLPLVARKRYSHTT